jgi:hypothetical protein
MRCNQGVAVGLTIIILAVTAGMSVILRDRFDKESQNQLDGALRRGVEAVETSLQGLDGRLLQITKAHVYAFRQSDHMSPQEGIALMSKMFDATPASDVFKIYVETLHTHQAIDEYLERMKTLYGQDSFIIYDLNGPNDIVPLNPSDYSDRLPLIVVQRSFPENWAGAGRFPLVGSRELRSVAPFLGLPSILVNGSAFISPVQCATVATGEFCTIFLYVPDPQVSPVTRGIFTSFEAGSLVPLLGPVTSTVFVEVSDATGQAFFQTANPRPSLDLGRQATFTTPMLNTHWNIEVTLIKDAISTSQWDTLKTVALVGGLSFGAVLSIIVWAGIESATRRQKRITAEFTRTSILSGIAHTVLTSLHKLSLLYSVEKGVPAKRAKESDPETKDSRHELKEPELADRLRSQASSGSLVAPSPSPLTIAKSTFHTIHEVIDLMRLLTRYGSEMCRVRMAYIQALVAEAFGEDDLSHIVYHLPARDKDNEVVADRLLLSIFLKRLVGNGLRHSQTSGTIHVFLNSRLPKPKRWERHWGSTDFGRQMLHFAVLSQSLIDEETLDALATIRPDSAHGLGYSVLSSAIGAPSTMGYLGVYRSVRDRTYPEVVVEFGIPFHDPPPSNGTPDPPESAMTGV